MIARRKNCLGEGIVLKRLRLAVFTCLGEGPCGRKIICVVVSGLAYVEIGISLKILPVGFPNLPPLHKVFALSNSRLLFNIDDKFQGTLWS